MKQLLCEMCGSNDLIKQDGVFVCQSCGCKYSVEEARKLMVEGTVDVSGSTVIVDNSQQIENDLKRAKLFEEEGNYSAAKEYYNKVLDADADNEEAQSGYDRIAGKYKYLDYYVVDTKYSSNDNLKRFFEGLSGVKNIAYDVYGEIKVKKVIEKYFDFSFLKADGRVNFTATRCDEYYENQTVYKERYNSSTQKFENTPVTEKVKKINRTPVSGSRSWNCERLFFSSNAIIDSLGGSKKAFVNELSDKIIENQRSNFAEYKPVKLDGNQLVEENETAEYQGIKVDISADRTKEKEESNRLLEKAMIKSIEGDLNRSFHTYFEDINYRTDIHNNTIVKILIPIQIIFYEYKGKEYLAIGDMVSDAPFVQTIPTDTQLNDSQKEIEQKKEELADDKRKKYGTGLIVGGIIGVPIIGAVVFFLRNDGFEGYSYVVVPMMIICCIIGICFLIAHYVKKSNIENEIRNKSDEYEKLLAPKKDLLIKSKAVFLKNYTNAESIESAVSAAKEIDCSNYQIRVLTSVAESSVDKSGFKNSENDGRLDEIKIIAKENKMQAIKKYMEVYDVGLAEAKEAVDKFDDNTETDTEHLSVDVSDDLDSEKEAALSEIKKIAVQNKIEAIKKYREIYNVGLAEAKEAVDKLIEE